MVTTNDNNFSRRKKKLINKKFQYHQMLVTVIGALVVLNIAVAMALILYGDTGFRDISVVETSILALVEILLVVPLMYISVSQSHKIAGPIFVFERSLRSLEEGDLTIDVRLRETDEFHESAHLFNTCVGSLRGRVTEIRDDLVELDALCDAGSPQKEMVESIVKKIGWFKLQ